MSHFLLEKALGETDIDTSSAVKALQVILELEGWLAEDLTKEKEISFESVADEKSTRNNKIRNGY